MRTGQLIGPYKILKELGHRSSGDLFLAMEVAGFGYVTLVVLEEADPLFAARFPNFACERAAAATFRHPCRVRLVEAGQQGGLLFLAQEHLKATTLQAQLDQGLPLPEDECLKVTRSVLDVVTKAHAAGVVHGALVPSSVYYTQDGDVKVDAFGSQSAPFNPPYGCLAPERRDGGPPTPEADLWSVAAIVACVALRGPLPESDAAPGAPAQPTPVEELPRRLLGARAFASVHPDLRGALATLLDLDPAKRSAGVPGLAAVLQRKEILRPGWYPSDQGQPIPADRAHQAELAQREEADSHFWAAMTHGFEGHPREALQEYRTLLGLPLAIVSPLTPKVEIDALQLFWKTGLAPERPGALPPPAPALRLEFADYVAFLNAALMLFGKLDREALRSIVERRLLETILAGCPEPAERGRLFREALMRCRDGAWTMRQHASFLEFEGRRDEALHQRLKLADLLARRGLYHEAAAECRDLRRRRDDVRLPDSLFAVADKAAKLELVAQGVLTMLKKTGGEALPAAEHYLTRMPGNLELLEQVAALKRGGGQPEEARALSCRAAGICWEQNLRDRALRNLAMVLAEDKMNLDALGLAVDLLQRQGVRPEGKRLTETADNVMNHLSAKGSDPCPSSCN